jgi:RimJ/RimL family protein N-acetyltransferase
MLEGSRIRLWSLEKFDISQNYHWGNDPELVRLAGMDPAPKSLVDIERWFETVHTSTNQKMFTIKSHEGDYLGNISLTGIDYRTGCTEIGLFLGDRTQWQRGVGTEAVTMVTRFAFGQLRLHRVEARVLAFNERAQRLFERCGFVREGVLRQSHYADDTYHDVVVYARLATDPPHASP